MHTNWSGWWKKHLIFQLKTFGNPIVLEVKQMKFKISHTSPFPSNLVNIYTEYYDQTENFKIAFIDKSMQT